MAEWLDPENLEEQDTNQARLNELSEDSDQVAAEVDFWPVAVTNVGNNSELLTNPLA